MLPIGMHSVCLWSQYVCMYSIMMLLAYTSCSTYDRNRKLDTHKLKILLAATWACEKFTTYVCSRENYSPETNHKPLIPLLSHTHLNSLPAKVVWIWLGLMRFAMTFYKSWEVAIQLKQMLFNNLPWNTQLMMMNWHKWKKLSSCYFYITC